MSELLRVYFDPAEIGADGYPRAWHRPVTEFMESARGSGLVDDEEIDNAIAFIDEPLAIKDLIRERDGHRCLRCGHPYRKGQNENGEWSRCDERCTHGGPVRIWNEHRKDWEQFSDSHPHSVGTLHREAQWRILTVHHLGEKYDCRWFLLVSLCQRCHLQVQAKVRMNRIWPWEHSNWFKPFAAAWYSWVYENREISYEEAVERMDELLAYERMA